MEVRENRATQATTQHSQKLKRLKILRILEPIALVLVPLTMGLCAYVGADATGGLMLLVSVLVVGLFFGGFEASRPGLRQIMPTVTLGAVAAAGRIIFAPFPDVKPVSAIAIVAGATLGRHCGFMVGALAALISNFFFGQGAWTPMQMYAWGLVGYLAGVLQDHEVFKHQAVLYVYGFLSGLLYGFILNGWYVLGYVRPLEWELIVGAYLLGLPLDLTHGIATVAFLALIWVPWGRSIRRVVAKYGLD